MFPFKQWPVKMVSVGDAGSDAGKSKCWIWCWEKAAIFCWIVRLWEAACSLCIAQRVSDILWNSFFCAVAVYLVQRSISVLFSTRFEKCGCCVQWYLQFFREVLFSRRGWGVKKRAGARSYSINTLCSLGRLCCLCFCCLCLCCLCLCCLCLCCQLSKRKLTLLHPKVRELKQKSTKYKTIHFVPARSSWE